MTKEAQNSQVITLWNTNGGRSSASFLLSVAGVAFLAYGIQHQRSIVAWVCGTTLVLTAGLVRLFVSFRPRSMTLSNEGLRILRGSDVEGTIPATAIRGFVLADMPDGGLQLRMRYDPASVPCLPPAIRRFSERCGLPSEEVRRALGRTTPPDTIPLGYVSSHPSALTLEKTFAIRRFIEATGMGEWHRIQADGFGGF